MPGSRQMQLSGWGNVPGQPNRVYRPERVSHLRDAVRAAPEVSLIARGMGRSYGDAALNQQGAVLLQTRLSRFRRFDRASGMLECEGGTTLEDILEVFVPRGFFPSVTPGTKYVTVGGAIAADVHGKNHHRDGSIAEFVDEIEVLTGSGDIIRCSRESHPDLFRATIGGMGLTGVILQARLRLQPIESAYVDVEYRRAANLEETLATLRETDDQFQYSVAWIDCLADGEALGRAVLMRGNHAAAGSLPAGLGQQPLRIKRRRSWNVPAYLPNFALSSWTVRLFNAHYYSRHQNGVKLVDYEEFFYPLDSVLHWNRIYGRRGFFQYQAVLPAETSATGLGELLRRLSSSRRASFLAVLKTLGKKSEGLLSFPMPGKTLALDLPNTGADTVAFLRELDQIVLGAGGRVYLAKDACMTPETFRRMYPNVQQFLEIKSRYDPSGRFSSSLSNRLGIGAER